MSRKVLVRVRAETHLRRRELRYLKRSLGRMLDKIAPGKDLELSVMLVGSGTMKRLNSEYLGLNETTDVLAFPLMAPGETGSTPPGGDQPEPLGDIVICVPVAECQARERGEFLQDELELLAAHGLLHLIGYDDDCPEARGGMAAMENELLGRSIIREG